MQMTSQQYSYMFFIYHARAAQAILACLRLGIVFNVSFDNCFRGSSLPNSLTFKLLETIKFVFHIVFMWDWSFSSAVDCRKWHSITQKSYSAQK